MIHHKRANILPERITALLRLNEEEKYQLVTLKLNSFRTYLRVIIGRTIKQWVVGSNDGTVLLKATQGLILGTAKAEEHSNTFRLNNHNAEPILYKAKVKVEQNDLSCKK